MRPPLQTMRRVLVVDDDADIREVLADIFEHRGFMVETAENGRVALTKASEHVPNVIVLDLMMPVMTGQEFLTAKAQHRPLADVPVVVATASSSRPVAGAARVLRKPFRSEDLLDVVERLCAVESA